MSFPFAKPASMTSPNGGHLRLGDFTTDLRVLVIATISVIVATAGVIAGVVLLQLIGRYRRVLLPLFQLHLTETGVGRNRYFSIRKRSAPIPRRIRQISCPTLSRRRSLVLIRAHLDEVMQLDRISKYTDVIQVDRHSKYTYEISLLIISFAKKVASRVLLQRLAWQVDERRRATGRALANV
jgi:hypothetical protein